MEKIAVIGAGTMGKQTALQTALSGFKVTLGQKGGTGFPHLSARKEDVA